MNNTITQELINSVDKSIKCLALELPELIWNDISARWDSLLKEITPTKIDRRTSKTSRTWDFPNII